MTENEIATIVIDVAYKIHIELGPGLLESAYEACMIYELRELGLKVSSQMGLPLKYRNVFLDCGYRIDLLIEDKFIVEIKSVQELNNIHMAQTITYLKLSGCKLGLLINFNVYKIKDGIRRVINGHLD